MRKQVAECITYIRKITDFKPEVGLVLGSGLGGYTRELDEIISVIPYNRIPGFPVSTVSGHAGKYIMGYMKGIPIIIMDGRVHYYEGYSSDEVVLPIRVMKALGTQKLILTNAAGGINPDYRPGDLVLVTDHISLFIPNPLRGPNDPDEGVRFPDMTNVYDPGLLGIFKDCAKKEGITVKEGVYCQLSGPTYETPAEIRIVKGLGADLVGMSTVVEAIAAKHMGMKTACISLVTNMAAGISKTPLSHEEVKTEGKNAAPRFTKLMNSVLEALNSPRQ